MYTHTYSHTHAHSHTRTHAHTHTQLHKTGKKLVLEQIVTTIATLADSVEAYFIPHYDHFMPSLKYIMINATDKEYRLLRGKTIECISLMGLAVGQEKVRGEARGRRARKRVKWEEYIVKLLNAGHLANCETLFIRRCPLFRVNTIN